MGTPPGGAIILGNSDGIPLEVDDGGVTLEGSCIMLEPIKRLEASFVAVATTDLIGVGSGVMDGMVGIAIVAGSVSTVLDGVADTVALAVADSVALAVTNPVEI